jgi:hypothetical protein
MTKALQTEAAEAASIVNGQISLLLKAFLTNRFASALSQILNVLMPLTKIDKTELIN